MLIMEDIWILFELKVKKCGRYGWCDYEWFDYIVLFYMWVGCGSIGKVEVDCCFMFIKFCWGVFGEL